MGLGNIRTALSYAHDARAWLKQARHAGTWVHTKAAKAPILSVVIPCHNAARWIATLVHSIQSQDIDELEILVVDDASTDASRAILNSLALLDKRIKVIDGEGRGPGAARNLAIQQAQGEFLTFADADDIVLPGAYSSMLDSLKTTGSDFVFGGYVRHKGSSVSRPQIVEATHREDLANVTAKTFPQAFEEPVLWNKIFRTEFWNTHVGPIPEEVNYEDQPPVLRAICAARSFDVLKRDVYSWRMSEVGTSRSNAKASLQDIQDRAIVTRQMWAEALQLGAPGEFLEFMLERFIARDIYLFAVHLPHKAPGDSYREVMRNLTTEMAEWSREFPGVFSRIPIQRRTLFWALAHGTDADVNEELGLRLDLKHGYAFGPDGTLIPSCTPHIERLPKELLQAEPIDVPVHAVVQELIWKGPYDVSLQIRAFMVGVDSSEVEIAVYALEHEGEVPPVPQIEDLAGAIRLDTRRTADIRNNAEIQDAWFDRERDSYEFSLDLRQHQHLGIVVVARWNGIVSIDYVKQSREPATRDAGPVGNQERWYVQSERAHGGPRFELRRRQVRADAHLVKNWRASLFGLHGSTTGVRDASSKATDFVRYLRPIGFRALLGWSRKTPLHIGGQTVEYVSLSEDEANSIADTVIRSTPDGHAYIDQKTIRVVADSASLRDGVFIVEGRCTSSSIKPTIWLRSSRDVLLGTTTWNRHKFRTHFKVQDARDRAYFLRFSLVPKNRSPRFAIEAGRLRNNTFLNGSVRSIRIEPRENGTTAVYFLPPTTLARSTSWETYQGIPEQTKPLLAGVFFESFSGKNAADNPGAICEYLLSANTGFPIWVSVRDDRVEIPEGAIPVITGSDAWYDKLTRAKVIVGNDNFPLWFRKRPGQYWVQTWHGWPIKRLLFDAHPNFVGLSYRRLMKRQASDWDLLLAQSDEAAQRIAGSAYYTGPVLEGEYPRNLALARAMQETASIKAKLGIPPGKRVILWAPTWRYLGEDLAFPADRIAKDNDAVVLVRGHHMKAVHKKGKNVKNVSSYPCVEELLVIADLLVSDYSSIFFDYALTGKPSIVYAPDLETYKTQERGFYSDWPNDSGRPVALTTKELESAITMVLRQTTQSKPDESAQQAAVQKSVLENLEQIETWIVQMLKS